MGDGMPAEKEFVIQLDEDDIAELAALAENADKLLVLLSISNQIGPKIGTRLIAEHLSEKIGLGLIEVSPMVDAILRIFRIRNEFGMTSEEAVKTIIRSLEKADGQTAAKSWKDEQVKIIKALDDLSNEHPLVVSFTVGSEASSIPNVVLSMELSTGTRPVFSESKDRILFTIISHTLSLEYHAEYRRHKEVHLSLDAGDITRLRSLCDQAEQAASTLKATITGPSASPWEDNAENAS
jgi:hypothetical protein